MRHASRVTRHTSHATRRTRQVELFKNHHIIFREGDRGDKMYIVVEGKVASHREWRGVAGVIASVATAR